MVGDVASQQDWPQFNLLTGEKLSKWISVFSTLCGSTALMLSKV